MVGLMITRSKIPDYENIKRFPFIDVYYVKELIEEKNFYVNEVATYKAESLTYNGLMIKYDTTLLYAAVTNNDEELVDYLLSKNADPNLPVRRDMFNLYALDRAIFNNNLSMVKKLKDHGAELEHPNNNISVEKSFNYTPLHNAIEVKNLEIIKYLIEAGVNVKNVFENSKLLYARYWSDCTNFDEIITLLCKNGADFETGKITPLELYSSILSEVVHYDRPKEVKNLLDLGANYTYVNCLKKNMSILHEAVEMKVLDSLVVLLEHKRCEQAYIDAVVTDKHCSLLHIAVYPVDFHYRSSAIISDLIAKHDYNLIRVVTHILNADINVDILDAKGKLAVDYISDGKVPVILKIKEHIVKLIAVGRYVCQRNVEAVEGPEFDDLRSECQEEVVKMKALIGTSNWSYSRFLKFSIHQSAVYLKNVDLSEIIDNNFDNKPDGTLCEMFPLYGGLIYYRLLRVQRRIELLKKASKVIEDIFIKILQYDFHERIYQYLTNDDLIKLSKQ